MSPNYDITAYKTLDSFDGGFDKLVNDHLNDGWEVYGNPYTNCGHLYQAVVKRGNPFVDFESKDDIP